MHVIRSDAKFAEFITVAIEEPNRVLDDAAKIGPQKNARPCTTIKPVLDFSPVPKTESLQLIVRWIWIHVAPFVSLTP